MEDQTYARIGNLLGVIAALITFVGAWWYCTANYGFLLGFGLGWLPAGIAATIVYFVVFIAWGLIALALGIGAALLVLWLFRR